MTRLQRVGRRVFIRDIGKGALAVAVVGAGLVACDDDDDDDAADSPSATGEPTSTQSPAASPAATETSTPTPTGTPTGSAGDDPAATAVDWSRVNLGFVSAYLLVRSGEAAVVDTGIAGSAGDIEAALAAASMGWGDVGHVIVTHAHPDHAGSLAAVLDLTPEALGYAGAGDIPAITTPRSLQAVGDGDRVFGLEIIETPGHTPGHISVLDRPGGLLLVGDALNGANGGVVGPNPDFSSDVELASASVVKLGGLEFETVLFGHGEPILEGAAAAVAELAATL